MIGTPMTKAAYIVALALIAASGPLAAEQTWTTSGATNFEAKSGDYPRCVQVVQGHFFATPKPGALKTWAAAACRPGD